MKKNYLFYVALFLGITFTNAQKTTIPDETFRQFLIAAGSLSVDIESTDFDEQELTTDIKSEILSVLTRTVYSKNEKSPLMVALQKTASSLQQCYTGQRKKIKYPKLWN